MSLDDDDLDAFRAPAPPAGFADRVVAAASAGPKKKRWPWWAVAAVAASALFLFVVRPRGPSAGALIAGTERTTRSIDNGRAIAVAEPGASLSWRGGRVTQTAGDVFYRVAPGGSFTVATAAGDVTVLGTCFRVEVTPMKPAVAAAISSVATAAVLVTVYEGKVRLANAHGTRQLVAGETARATPDRAPAPPDAPAGSPAAKIVARVDVPPPPEPPADGITRDQLLARDAQQRAQIAHLGAQIQALQGELKDDGPAGKLDADRHFFNTPKDELLELAKTCSLQYDAPPLSGDADFSPEDVAAAGLGTDEGAAAKKATADFQASTLAQLRALYITATNDTAGADQLDARALETEIESKSTSAVNQAAYQEVSAERAGLRPVPDAAAIAQEPPAEQLARIMDNLGDTYEQALAQAVGSDKAHALRALHGGWGTRMVGGRGCPGDK